MSRRGPISFAQRIRRNTTAHHPENQHIQTDNEPLEKTKWVMNELNFTSRSGYDDFLDRHPDFPRIKLGNSYRYHKASVRAWILQEQARQIEARKTEEKAG
jgi:hypothetical protein